MHSTSKPCPDQQTLLQFIQGRLEPPTLDQCENHVSDCESCHETLRGLDANDTLSHYVSEALEQQPLENQSDTNVIDGLMQRLLQPGGAGRSTFKSSSGAEILADRAAEVLRCVEPAAVGDEGSLGTLGDYRLLHLLGAGGTGVVFQAMDVSLNRVVALKVLRPSLGDIARDRFIAEARLAASIDHDNVVTIYQIGQEGRLAFIAMQWLPGETLESKLNRESGLLDEVTVREFVSQIASGLSAAHQRQLIHRDIKPANIWICDETSRIKILDFGLARIADEESSLTQTGMLAGTPNFMSPEQAKGMELDPRSDLFSLGCVLYLLLTGRLPFSAPTVLGTLQTIQSDSPQPPIALNPDCDADLSDLTMSLLEKLPGNRLASADNLISSLNNPRQQWPQKVAVASNTAPSVSGKALAADPASTRSSTNGVRWLIATAVLGILGVTGWLMAPQIFRIITDQGELVVETEDPNIKIEVRENGGHVQIFDLSSNESFDIRSGNYEFSATKEGSNTEFEVTPKSVKMTRGGKELVSVTIRKTEPSQIASAEDKTKETSTVNESKTAAVPIYRGRNFEQWFSTAKNDREPQTIADAIAACATIANEEQKGEYLELLRKLMREHGAAHGMSSILLDGFIHALVQLKKDGIVDFVQTEIEKGNERSLGCCSFITRRFSIDPSTRLVGAVQLDVNRLLQRITSRELNFDDNTYYFLEYALSVSKVGLDLEVTKDFIRQIDIANEHTRIYPHLLRKFQHGELDELIEAKFFDAQTAGDTRSEIIHSLQLSNGTIGSLSELLNRLLIKSIAGTVSDENAIDFGTYSELWYDDQGKISTAKYQNSGTQWLVSGNYTTSQPKGAKFVTGRAAVIRHLLTILCKSVRNAKPVDEDREKVLNFANEISRSTALSDIFKSKEDLKIAEDIKTLIDAIEGNKKEYNCSPFVAGGRNGGGGGWSGWGSGAEGGGFADGGNAIAEPETVDTNSQPKMETSETKAGVASGGENESGSSLDNIDSPEKFRAAIAAMKVQRDQLLEKFGAGHPSVQPIERKIASTEKHFAYLISNDDAPIYGGRNFEQWHRIAEHDREPQSIADAIAACATLADDDQKGEFVKLLRKLVRKYGASHCQPVNSGGGFSSGTRSTSNIMFTGFVSALNQLEIDEVVDFIQTEIEQGNEHSLGFCSCVVAYLDFGNQKKIEAWRSMQLNLSPLLKRVNARELKSDDVQAFLDYALSQGGNALGQGGGGFISIGTDLDLDLTRVFLKDPNNVEYAWIYSSFMKKFHQGELDDIVEARFFDPQTSGETRTEIIHSLQFHYWISNTGGGGGAGPAWSRNSVLLNRLLTNSITKILNTEDALAFEGFSEFWYAAEKEIKTWKDQNGETKWQVKGSYTTSKPDDAKSVEGKVAIIRHLLGKLCESVRATRPKGIDREHVLSFANKTVRSSALRDIIEPKGDLKIAEDLKALSEAIKGDAEKDNFSDFVASPNSSGAYGGNRGGGIF